MSVRVCLKLFCVGALLATLFGCASKDPYADYRPPEIGSYSEEARRRLAEIDRQRKELEQQRIQREQVDVQQSEKELAKARKAAAKREAEERRRIEKEQEAREKAAEKARKEELAAQRKAEEDVQKQAESAEKAREVTASDEADVEPKRSWFGRRIKTEDEKAATVKPAKIDPDVPVAPFGPYELQSGDALLVSIQVFPTPQQHEDIIDEDGMITLPYLGNMKAAGKTSSTLERDIAQAYQDAEIYKIITVKVVVPTHSYYVRGEVKKPGRFQLTSDGVSILQAIASAGGYTEYAKRSVILIRNGKSYPISTKELDRHPEKDWPLLPGDVLTVERSYF